jgi:hypothetical protein
MTNPGGRLGHESTCGFSFGFFAERGVQLMNKMKLVPRVVGGYTHSSVNYRELGDWRDAQRKLEMRWLATKLRRKTLGSAGTKTLSPISLHLSCLPTIL